MYIVSDLLKIKGRAVWACSPTTTLLDALKLMAEKNIGALLVMEGDEVAGILPSATWSGELPIKVNACWMNPFLIL